MKGIQIVLCFALYCSQSHSGLTDPNQPFQRLMEPPLDQTRRQYQINVRIPRLDPLTRRYRCIMPAPRNAQRRQASIVLLSSPTAQSALRIHSAQIRGSVPPKSDWPRGRIRLGLSPPFDCTTLRSSLLSSLRSFSGSFSLLFHTHCRYSAYILTSSALYHASTSA